MECRRPTTRVVGPVQYRPGGRHRSRCVRRDEDPTRAKERYFSPRDKNMEWNVEDQPPELWDQFNTDLAGGTHLRVHPLLHWTEMNIWEYAQRENIPNVPLYFAK